MQDNEVMPRVSAIIEKAFKDSKNPPENYNILRSVLEIEIRDLINHLLLERLMRKLEEDKV